MLSHEPAWQEKLAEKGNRQTARTGISWIEHTLTLPRLVRIYRHSERHVCTLLVIGVCMFLAPGAASPLTTANTLKHAGSGLYDDHASPFSFNSSQAVPGGTASIEDRLANYIELNNEVPSGYRHVRQHLAVSCKLYEDVHNQVKKKYAGLLERAVRAAALMSFTHVSSKNNTKHHLSNSRTDTNYSSCNDVVKTQGIFLANLLLGDLVMASSDIRQVSSCWFDDSQSQIRCSSIHSIRSKHHRGRSKSNPFRWSTEGFAITRIKYDMLASQFLRDVKRSPPSTSPQPQRLFQQLHHGTLLLRPLTNCNKTISGPVALLVPIFSKPTSSNGSVTIAGFIDVRMHVRGDHYGSRCSHGNQSVHFCPADSRCNAKTVVDGQNAGYDCTCRPGYYPSRMHEDIRGHGKGTGKNMTIDSAQINYWLQSMSDRGMSRADIARHLDKSVVCTPCHTSCRQCIDGRSCETEASIVLVSVLSLVNLLAILLTLALLLFVLVHRNSVVMLSSSWPFLIASLCGAMMVFTTELQWPGAVTHDCISDIFLYHLGFFLFYASLFVKMWRIGRLLSPNVLNMVLNGQSLRNKTLVLHLLAIMAVTLVYLVMWMLVDPPYLSLHGDGNVNQYTCRQGNFEHGILAAQLLFMLWGLVLCVKTRRATGRFTEAKGLSFSIYIYLVVVIVTEVLEHCLIQEAGRGQQQLFNTVRIHYTISSGILIIFLPKIIRIYFPDTPTSKAKTSSSNTSQANVTRARPPAALKKRPSLGKISPGARSTLPHMYRADSVSLLSLHTVPKDNAIMALAATGERHAGLRRTQSLSWRPGRRSSIASTHSMVIQTKSDACSGSSSGVDHRRLSISGSTTSRLGRILKRSSSAAGSLPVGSLPAGSIPSVTQDKDLIAKADSIKSPTESRHPTLIPRRSSDMSSTSFVLPPTLTEECGELLGFERRDSDLSEISGYAGREGRTFSRQSSDVSMRSFVSGFRTPSVRAASLSGSVAFSRHSSNVSNTVVPEKAVVDTLNLSASDFSTSFHTVRFHHQRKPVSKTTSLELFTRQGSDLSAQSLRMAQQACASILGHSPSATLTPAPRSIVRQSPASSVRAISRQVSFDSTADNVRHK